MFFGYICYRWVDFLMLVKSNVIVFVGGNLFMFNFWLVIRMCLCGGMNLYWLIFGGVV